MKSYYIYENGEEPCLAYQDKRVAMDEGIQESELIKVTNTDNEVLNFLYKNPPTGFPSNVTIGCEFEAGGAYENWGFVVRKDKNIVASHRDLIKCIEIARKRIVEAMSESEIKQKNTLEKIVLGNKETLK